MKKQLGLIVYIAFLFAVTLEAQSLVQSSQLSQITISDNFTFSEDLYEPIFVIADNIVIDGNGFTLQGPGYGFEYYGIQVGGLHNVTIKNVTIKGWLYGIWLVGSYRNHIIGNTITINRFGIGFEGKASRNSISNNTITHNGEDGIVFGEGSSVYNRISNNTITNNEDVGIFFDRSVNYTSILDNTFTNNEAGIGLRYSSYNIISGNILTHNDGIGIYFSSHNNIENNTITNNRDLGIWLYNSSNNNIYDNTITNTAADRPSSLDWMAGISIIGESLNNVIYHNNIIENRRQVHDTNPAANNWHHPELLEGNYWSDYPGMDDGSGTGKHAIAGDGIGDTNIPWPDLNFDAYPFVLESGWNVERPVEYITFTEDRYEPIVALTDNLVIDGNGYTLQGPGSGTGIYLDNRYNVTIKNLRVTGWDWGINIGADSNQITLIHNSISDNQLGIFMRMFCSDISIDNNTISHNADGIHMEYCSHVNIVSNTITNNHLGVRMWPPSHVLLYDNDIYNNYDGIHMVYSSDITIFNNLIFHNDYTGVYMENCSDITMIRNSLIENPNHVYDNRANQFDDGAYGNYWSDYTGTDTNGDWIGETPYLIDTDSMDNYPIMNLIRPLPLVYPSANFTYSPSDPSIKDVIAFLDTSVDEDGTISSWQWDFGDGVTSTDQNPSHQYSDKIEYTIQLLITDNDGFTNTIEQTILIRNLHPTASFTYSPSDPTVGDEVLFTDASSDPEGQPITWDWDFGDGSTSSAEDPSHAYETADSYIVTLTVTDDEGLESTYTVTIEVESIEETEQEGAFIPGFSFEIGLLAAIVLFGFRKQRMS